MSQSSPGSSSTTIQVPEKLVINLGDGLNLTTMESRVSCVQGTKVRQRQIKTEYFIDRPLQPAELVEALLSQGRLNTKTTRGLGTDQIYRDSYKDKRRTLSYLVKVIDGESTLENPVIDEDKVMSGICGQAFVDKVNPGGYVLLRVHLDFLSENDAGRVSQFGHFESLGINELERFLRGITVDLNDSVQVTLEMEQVGGDPVKLLQLFGASKSQLSCRYPAVAPCFQLALGVRDYMISPEQFIGQFTGPDTAPVRFISLRNYKDSDIDIASLIRKRDRLSELSSALDAAMHQLDEQLQTLDDSPIAPLRRRLRESLSLELTEVLREKKSCFEPGATCRASIKLPSPRASIVAPDVFLDFCRSRYKPAALNIFVDAMRELLGPLSCAELNEQLSQRSELNLSSLGLDDLRYLSGLYHLEVLNLSGNNLRRLDTLPLLPRLYFLNLSRNRINSLQGLEQLPGIKRLNLDRNQLTGLDIPLTSFPLQGLRITDNPLDRPEDLRQETGPIQAVYITHQDVCSFYGNYALAKGMIKKDDLVLYQSIEFAPVFKPGTHKNAIQDWVNCIVAIESYEEQFPALEVL